MKLISIFKLVIAGALLTLGVACNDKSSSQPKNETKTEQQSTVETNAPKSLGSINQETEYKGIRYTFSWNLDIPVFKITKNDEVVFEKRIRSLTSFGYCGFKGEMIIKINDERIEV